MFLQGSGEGAVRTFFNVYLDDALGAPTGVIGVLAAVGQLASAPVALLMPAAAKRWGHRRVFGWGTLGIGFGMLPLALVPGWAAAGAGYLVVISLVSLTRAAVGVYLMEAMPGALRTTMSGVYTMAMGLSWSAAALGGSRAITTLGYPAFLPRRGRTHGLERRGLRRRDPSHATLTDRIGQFCLPGCSRGTLPIWKRTAG